MQSATRVRLALLVSGLFTFVWTAVAALATRPRLAAKVFGESTTDPVSPLGYGLEADDVEYAAGCRAWWLPTTKASPGSVVIVHGFEPTQDPRATDPGPRLELAALLEQRGIASLVINLGYASGAHLHTGGPLEADDIAAAVRWVRERSADPVAIVGYSAGGHAAVVAAMRCAPAAVVTDSSFVDFGEVVADQASQLLKLPAGLFRPVPRLMAAMTGHRPVRIDTLDLGRRIPMLHVHGSADTAIGYGNLDRLAAITGGRTMTIEGADHLEGLHRDPEGYAEGVVGFLHDALGRASDVSEAHS